MIKKQQLIIIVILLLLSSINSYADKEDMNRDINIQEIRLLPIRDLFLSLGYDVEWVHSERKVIVKKEDKQIKFIESKDINSRYVIEHIYPMVIINNKSYFPTSILETLGIDYEQQKDKIKIGERIKVGDKAPDFILQNSVGEKVSLKDFKGQTTIICFWTTWCSYCTEEITMLNELSQVLYEKNISVVLVNVDDEIEKDKVTDYIEEHKLSHEVLIDTNSSVKTKYNVDSIPYMYILDEKGNVISIKKGLINKEQLLDIIEKL